MCTQDFSFWSDKLYLLYDRIDADPASMMIMKALG
jgi:hypothetical protein